MLHELSAIKPTKKIKKQKTKENEEIHEEKKYDKKGSTTNTTEAKIINWEESVVEQWFKDKNLNISIFNDLKPCNGKILNQLRKMMKTAPEFFYCALTKNTQINLREVAIFTYELEQLFLNV